LKQAMLDHLADGVFGIAHLVHVTDQISHQCGNS
jgi:hypothetical protein